MGKAARVRKDRGRNLRLVFCDFDFDRGSRPYGPGVEAAPPEAWAIGRCGLVHARWNGQRLDMERDELVTGPEVAGAVLSALDNTKGVIIGHGLLSSDLRSLNMVTGVPDSILRRCVDTLALAHRVRGMQFPTGCGLGKLAPLNLKGGRSKPSYPQSAPGLRKGMPVITPHRGNADPREDAYLVARLWETMMTTRVLSWGAGEPSWTHYDGDTRPGTPGGTAALDETALAELTGQQRQPESREWHHRLLTGGRVLLPTKSNYVASRLVRFARAQLNDLSQLRVLAAKVHDTREIPRVESEEDLLTACQWLGAKTNLDIRERLFSGRALTKKLRIDYAIALWESTHSDFMREFMDLRRRGREDVSALLEAERMKQVQYAVRPKLAEAVT